MPPAFAPNGPAGQPPAAQPTGTEPPAPPVPPPVVRPRAPSQRRRHSTRSSLEQSPEKHTRVDHPFGRGTSKSRAGGRAMKMKLSGKSIQESLLRHVEKIIFGVALLVLLLLADGMSAARGSTSPRDRHLPAAKRRKRSSREAEPCPPAGPAIPRIRQPDPQAHLGTALHTGDELQRPTVSHAWSAPPAKVLAVTKLKATPGVGAVRNPVTAGSIGGSTACPPWQAPMEARHPSKARARP